MKPTLNTLRATALAALISVLAASAEAQSCLADQWEGDDTCANANVITTESLCRTDATLQTFDNDWYEVTLQPGERLEFGVRAELGAVIELTSFNGCNPQPLGTTQGNSPSLQSTNASLSSTIVRIRIRLIQGAPTNCAFYDLSVIRRSSTLPCSQDSFEPNNCEDAAAPITEGLHTGLTVHPDSPDWYEIEVFGRKTVEFVRPIEVAGIQLQLCDEDGTFIGYVGTARAVTDGTFIDVDSNVVSVTKETLIAETYRLLVIDTGTADTCRSYTLRVNVLSEFEEYCFGSGANTGSCTECPCNNDAAVGQVGGCLNSNGLSAVIAAEGTASLANDTLSFLMASGNPNTFAILISGDSRAPNDPNNLCLGQGSGIQSSSLDGLRCTVGNVLRHGVRAIDSSGAVGFTNARWGWPDGPVGGLLAQGGFVAGQARNFQAIYREDPAALCGSGQSTTQAIHVIVRP